MQKLLSPWEAKINGEVVAVSLLWSKQSSLDNKKNIEPYGG